MTNGKKSGTIEFLGSEYSVDALTAAFGKAGETFVEPGVEVHQQQLNGFDQATYEEWADRFKKYPIVTLHEGKYVFLWFPNDWRPDVEQVAEGDKKKTILKVGFKARFVTKYGFNRAKFDPNAKVVVEQEPEDRFYENRPQQRTYGYQGRPNHNGGGYQGNRRFGGRNS